MSMPIPLQQQLLNIQSIDHDLDNWIELLRLQKLKQTPTTHNQPKSNKIGISALQSDK